jgi:cyclophilin family peptidyl-prolyl cis-trans isomerase
LSQTVRLAAPRIHVYSESCFYHQYLPFNPKFYPKLTFDDIRYSNSLYSFAPFGQIVDGMDVVDQIYKIGEKPSQGKIQSDGNRYLKTTFPQLTYIESFEEMSTEL